MGKVNKKLLACVVVFLIVSMSMTLFVFRTNVEGSIFGAKYYYLSLEKQNIDKMKSKLKESYLEKYLTEYSYTCKATAQLDGDLMSTNQEMKLFADILSKVELSMNYNSNTKDLKDMYYTSFISTKYDEKKLLDLDVKSADNKTTIAFPGLSDKIIGLKNPESTIKFTQAYLGDAKAFEEVCGITRETYSKMIEKYLKDIIMKEIPDDNVVFEGAAEFENIKCNSITFKIDEKIIANILKAVSKELANDKDFKTLVTSLTYSFIEAANYDKLIAEKPTAEEIGNQIQEMCEELSSEAEYLDEEIQLTYTVYFQDNGGIMSRQLKDDINDTVAILSTYKNLSGADIFDINVQEEEAAVFQFTNQSKIQSGSTYAGKVNLDISGKSLLEAEYTYEKDARAGNLSAFVGEIDVKINSKQLDSNSEDIYFNFISKKKDVDTLVGKAKVTSKVDGKRMGVTLFTEVKQSNIANITKPKVDLEGSIQQSDMLGVYQIVLEIGQKLRSNFPELFPQDEFEENSLFNDYNEF